jgi:tetratricopeptide (TPR) repeat protein
VQGLIAARIDGLAPEEKALLQNASVIGKVFWPSAVPGADPRILHGLERKEFVRRDRRSAIAGETQFAFLHALVRDVTYGQIPRAERADKHRLAAEWLASLAGDRTEDHAEMLAHHYREALSLAEAAGIDTASLREPARQAFVEGARRALSLNAGATVYELALEALAVTDPDDRERPSVLLLAAQGARDLAHLDATDLLDEALDGFLALGDPAQAAEAAEAAAREALHRGNVAQAIEKSERALALARSAPLTAASARALNGRARGLDILQGSSAEAIALASEMLAFADEAGDERLAMTALGTIGLARVHSGDANGIEDLEKAAARGERAGAFSELGTTLNNLANCLWEVGRLDDSAARYGEAREVCERYGFTAGISWLDGERVYECDRRGDLEGVLAAAAYFLARPDAPTSYQTRPVLITRARSLLARGQVDDALADAEEALASFRESGPDAQVANELLTTAARCARAAGRQEEADALLAEALTAGPKLFNELPLDLLELGREGEYLALTDDKRGHVWEEAGRAAAAGDLVRASEIYGSIGARFAEAWAALLAAERGDTSRLDAALAYFEEQRATPYVQRCRALMQASA